MAVKTIALEEIKFKELAAAVKALNDSGLLEENIPTVGPNKGDLIKKFVAGVLSIPDDEEGNWKGPALAGEYYQKITIAEEQASVPDRKKTQKNNEKKKEGKTSRPQKAGKSAYLKELIDKGTMKKAEIIDAVQKKFPDSSSASTISMISHGMNEKYKSLFGNIIVKGKDEKLHFKK